jgi:Domain of unknown function (DUF4411)
MRYSIDTSAILDGWQRYYPPEVFPGLWERLEDLIDAGDLRASEEVLRELEKRDDDVLAWAHAQVGFSAELSEDVQDQVSNVLASYPKLIDTRKNRSAADPFVIATALVENCTVVTGELPSGSSTRPHIPDVCIGLGVDWCRLVDLIKLEGWTFR